MITDLNLAENGGAILSTELEVLKQEIEILFETRPGDLLGEADYGTDYSKNLYILRQGNEALRSQIAGDLSQLELFGYQPSIEISLMQGTERDIALIKVDLQKDDEKYTELYKIS